MRWDPSPELVDQDRRVRKSRTALLAAAIRLVSERGTAAVTAGELAEAADVSRKLLYLHFGDRDRLLVAATVDLVERDLLTHVHRVDTGVRGQLAVTTRHFAEHRAFYRPVLTGSCAYAVTSRLNGLFGQLSADSVRDLYGEVDRRTLTDLGVFFAGGAGTLVYDWLINAVDPLHPDDMADRLHRVAAVLGRSITDVEDGR